MNVSEWQDRHEYKYHLTEEEERQAENDKRIEEYFKIKVKAEQQENKLKEEVRIWGLAQSHVSEDSTAAAKIAR